MLRALRRVMGFERIDATVKMHMPGGPNAMLYITNSSPRRVEHVVELLLENGWTVEEIVHEGPTKHV